MADNEPTRKRRRKVFTESDKKKRRLAYQTSLDKTRVYVGKEFGRWQQLKESLSLKTNEQVATLLLDRFNSGSATCWRRREMITEHVEEITAETRLCPLCQRHQKDSGALSLHLTKKHSVHPACLDNLLINAPYANPSFGPGQSIPLVPVRESSVQNINGTSQPMSPSNTKSPNSVQQNGSSQENDACDESGVKNRGCTHGDTESLVNNDESNDKNNAAADGNANRPFKCHSCLEFFSDKSALSVHYHSATHIQKIRTGARNDSDSSSPVLSYPYASSKPYQCDVCHVSYFYAFGLESHLKSVLHQSRTRKAENAVAKTNPETRIVVASQAGATVANPTHLASAKTCNCGTQAEKLQLQPASSLIPAPVVSAQAVPTVLPFLALAPNTVPHTIVPSVFPPSGTQLIPQPQMLMPLIVKGVQTSDAPQQILQQAVPVLGLSDPRIPILGPRDSENQAAVSKVSSVSRIPLKINTSVDEVGVKIKIEIKDEPCDHEVSERTCIADAAIQVGLKQEYNRVCDGIEGSVVCGDKQQSKAKVVNVEEANEASTTQDLQNSHVKKSSPVKNNPSDANHGLTTLNTKPCSSLSLGPPVLTEFQSQVLWAFLESRDESDSEIPPREDCEALGREVGLTEDEVREWLVDNYCGKHGHCENVQSCCKNQEGTDDEETLTIDESGGTVLRSTTDFVSDEEDVDDEQITVGIKRKRSIDKENPEKDSGGTEC
ncbi:uncharacterized protein LOC128513880 [Clarias gariepinus]|uniref:uncharacterized protein LOC128513880 n=1 Tax=Clarias gariepinus TaxID=13013 RepID=UPI00234D2BA2|nr:uncharacterized protein LOC128513880 [Clarias gariepinus]